ncbi:MAG: alcohol dehydrogenase catalytic domain-containing protein [Gammaproteobacteria bacterium]|nr:alcohol dehydrogenase catalytic domain-containing protein [Gammaproteobacteria bacterium]
MKAALLKGLNEPLEIRDDVELVDLGANEVHVKIVSSGVCHSDLSPRTVTIPTQFPSVLGHEGAGVIQEVGDGVRGLNAGDKVIISFVPACTHCNPCLRGQVVPLRGRGTDDGNTPFQDRRHADSRLRWLRYIL